MKKKDLIKFFEDNFYLWNKKTIGWNWVADYNDFPITPDLKKEVIQILKKQSKRRKNEKERPYKIF